MANPGTLQAQYDPSVDEVLPLAKEENGAIFALPEYAHLLENGTPDFGEVYPEPNELALQRVLKSLLPFEVYDYLEATMGFAKEVDDKPAVPHAPVSRAVASQYPIPQE